MSNQYYILEHGQLARNAQPLPAFDAADWAQWLERNREGRRVALTEIRGVRISTVFLGLDHSWDQGPPVLWETMIFEGPLSEYQERYRSLDDALQGHIRAVGRVRATLNRPRWRATI